MPANLLIFDADYVAELTGRMKTACQLMAEAVSSLKSASNHDKWKCKERSRILEDFGRLNEKLGRLDTGVNATTKALGESVSQFAMLESKYNSQAETLSDELTSNHGYSATVRTEGGSSSQSGNSAQSSAQAGQAQTTTSDAGKSEVSEIAEKSSGGNGGRGQGHGSNGVASAIAGRIPGKMMPSSNGTGTNTGRAQSAGTEGGIMNVNLPVTHIPDSPDSAAKGTKDTREIAQAAVTSVAYTMTAALRSNNKAAAPTLAEAYNAGRTIFENSTAIIASPTQPHTNERLAMASGLVNLAGINLQEASSSAESVSVSSSFSDSAGSLLEAIPEDAGEFRQVLGALTGKSSSDVSVSAASSSSGGSFFDKILEALKNTASGDMSSAASSGTSSLFESSPVMEFLGNFMMG